MIKRIHLGLGGTAYSDVAIQRAVGLAGIHGALIGRAAYWTGIRLSSRTWVDQLSDDLQNRKRQLK